MVNVRAQDPFAKVSLMVGVGLALLAVAAPAPAYVVEAVTTISAAEGEDRTRLDGAIQGIIGRRPVGTFSRELFGVGLSWTDEG